MACHSRANRSKAASFLKLVCGQEYLRSCLADRCRVGRMKSAFKRSFQVLCHRLQHYMRNASQSVVLGLESQAVLARVMHRLEHCPWRRSSCIVPGEPVPVPRVTGPQSSVQSPSAMSMRCRTDAVNFYKRVNGRRQTPKPNLIRINSTVPTRWFAAEMRANLDD